MKESSDAKRTVSEPKTPTEQEHTVGRIATDQTISAEERTPAGWETPSELEAKAKLARNESTEKLHTLYEKARYSKEGCTKEEAEAPFL